jgi:NAD(P)-dependent dehydrogenase (short-subunit alcohol dehydrogenase family)
VPTAAIDYSAAKAAVAGLSRRVASELASFGITVNTIMPGPILTPRFAGLHGELMNQLEHAVPAGRLGKPEEIAYAVWFLCAPGAAFTTGATLDVNGGGWTG